MTTSETTSEIIKDHPVRARLNRNSGLLAICAVALGTLALNTASESTVGVMSSTAEAAQSQPGGGLISAAEQRKQIIAKLNAMDGSMKALESRLAAIDRTLNSGLNVRVKEMPRERGGDEGK